MPSEIVVRSDDRVFLCGKTGAGKTFAARRLCMPIKRLIVIDPKARIDPGRGAEGWNLIPYDNDARRLLKGNEAVRALVQAPVGTSLEEAWEPVYKDVLEAGNCTIYIDETYGVTGEGRPSPYLTALWTRGRGLGIGAYSASQRPVWVPIVMLSEATHFFCFRLRVYDDRRRMSEHMGPEVLEEVPRDDKHGLYYMHELDFASTYLPEIPKLARRRTHAVTA